MKKMISLVVILTVISMYGFCLAAEQEHYKTRGWLNGFYWDYLGKLKDDEAKMAYVLGLMDGINIAQGFAKDTDKLLRINQIMEGLIPPKIKEAIDTTFSDELNRKLPVYIVLILEVKKMKNEISPEDYNRNIDELRKMYENG